jgi:hypothetical protein
MQATSCNYHFKHKTTLSPNMANCSQIASWTGLPTSMVKSFESLSVTSQPLLTSMCSRDFGPSVAPSAGRAQLVVPSFWDDYSTLFGGVVFLSSHIITGNHLSIHLWFLCQYPFRSGASSSKSYHPLPMWLQARPGKLHWAGQPDWESGYCGNPIEDGFGFLLVKLQQQVYLYKCGHLSCS